jgi:hypothetical protein
LGAAADGEDEEPDDEPDEEPHPAATRPAQAIASTGKRQGRRLPPAALVRESMFVRALRRGNGTMLPKIATSDCAAQEDLTSRSRNEDRPDR